MDEKGRRIMHGCFSMETLVEDENSATVRLFTETDRFRRIWAVGMKPDGNVRQSEIFVLASIVQLSKNNTKPVTMGQLAKHMHQSMPGISQKIRELEKHGYVKRAGNAEDRRVVSIELTPEGVEMSTRELRRLVGGLEKAMERLGPEKIDALIALMAELRVAITDVLRESSVEGDETNCSN